MTIVESDGLVMSLTESETKTWETASEWDGAVSEDPNVVHEAYGDLEGAGVVQLGYPSADPGGSNLAVMLPSDENSGTVLSNAAGAPDFDIVGGPTLGSTGAFETTAPNYDGTDDGADAGDFSHEGAGQFTFFAVVKFDTIDGSGNHRIISRQGGTNDYVATLRLNSGNLEVLARETANNTLVQATGTTSLSTGTWYFVAGYIDAANDTIKAYLDGSEEASATGTLSGTSSAWSDDTGPGWTVAYFDSDGTVNKENVDGIVEYPHLFLRTLSATEISNMSSLSGSLTTATKTFGSSVTPDLTALDYSLNSQSIDLDVIGSPGTASEEIVTQTLDGATSYTLTWSSSHTDFRIRPNFSTTVASSSPVVRSVSLTS